MQEETRLAPVAFLFCTCTIGAMPPDPPATERMSPPGATNRYETLLLRQSEGQPRGIMRWAFSLARTAVARRSARSLPAPLAPMGRPGNGEAIAYPMDIARLHC